MTARERDRVAELEKAVQAAAWQMPHLIEDHPDPGTAALGALWLLRQATIGAPVPDAPDDGVLHLRWGLGDVELGDDDGATILPSCPGGRPAVLELDADRLTALRDDLRGGDES